MNEIILNYSYIHLIKNVCLMGFYFYNFILERIADIFQKTAAPGLKTTGL